MTQTTCATCWKTTDDKHILCTSCETQLQFDLQWFENHLQDLEWRTNRMDKTGNGGGGGHNGLVTSPAPLRETAFELIEGNGMDDIPSLRDIINEYARCLNVTAPYDRKLEILIRNIRLTDKWKTSKATPTYARIIHRIRRKAQELLDFTLEDQIIIGECPTEDCHRIVKVIPNATFAPKCPDCGQVYPVSAIRENRRRKLLATHITGTQTEIRRLLLQCGIIVKPGTMRSWVSRGDLKPVTPVKDTRKQRYRLSDVYKLAVRNPEKETNIWMLLQEEQA